MALLVSQTGHRRYFYPLGRNMVTPSDWSEISLQRLLLDEKVEIVGQMSPPASESSIFVAVHAINEM